METAAKQARAGDSTDDRLSALPDELLHHVLSFLPSRRAVQTGVLSKRWTGLWRSVRRIDIRFDVHTPNYVYNSYSKEKWEKAEVFINNLFKFHDAPSLDAFQIYIGSNHNDLLPTIDRWVCQGMEYLPHDVEIVYSSIEGAYMLPHLGSSTALLKKLCLSGVYLDYSFQAQLRSGFPVLEDLTLHDCCTYFDYIQSSTLKKFVLRHCYRSSKMLVIRAPALVSLHIVTVLYDNGVALDGPMNHLVNAYIFPFDNGSSNFSRVSLLGSLFNVTNLELVGLSAQVMLDEGLDKYPVFMNLKTLSLYRCLYSKTLGEDGCLYSSCDPNEKLKALGRLLHKAPNLERLTLQSCWPLQESKQKVTASDLSLRSLDQKDFNCPSLKFIEIKYKDDGTDDENQMFQLVCGLLRNLQNPAVTFSRTKGTWSS
uniref:Uncharacterized protein n=1 Tax=Avena sativa TaxID=4498 RepID=A0ACD6AFC4_AVESA